MATKLLLVEDVEDLGRCGDVVNVKAGFARNFLLPRGYAIVASKHTLRMQARLQEERKKQAILDRQESENLAASLVEIQLSAVVKVDHEGHMYGSVSVNDIVHLLQEQASIEIEKRAIALKHPIKTTGEHEIPLKLKEGVSATVKLKIISENENELTSPTSEKE